MPEQRSRGAEVLGEHVVRRVLEPIAEQEGIVLVEVTVVEHEEELAAVRTEPLDRVRKARCKVPEIADPDVVDEVPSLRIDGGDPRCPVEHVGPLGGFMPMQLTHPAGIQAHIDAGDVLGHAELAHRHLPRPAARLEPHMGI
jgi:hypothetical protein